MFLSVPDTVVARAAGSNAVCTEVARHIPLALEVAMRMP